MTAQMVEPTPGSMLSGPVGGRIHAPAHLSGFGGLHGGLALGLMTAAMQERLPGTPLHSVTGRYHRPIDGEFDIEVDVVREGRRVSVLACRAVGARGLLAEASAVFGAYECSAQWPEVAPPMPEVPSPVDCEVFSIPVEFVPIAAMTEIRPVGDARPYAGCAEAELVAWIRLVQEDEAPCLRRLVFLMDALAPSYAALLTTPALVPTVELTVRPSPGLADATSPWVLLKARTTGAGRGGWSHEHIDAWGQEGTYLGCAQQLRVLRTF